MLLFRSEEHVERSGKPRGAFLTPEQQWLLSDAWYQDRGDPAWRRKTADEAEAVFAAWVSSARFGNYNASAPASISNVNSTANLTANLPDNCGRGRMIMERAS